MALHSRRTILKGVTASAVALAGCTGPAYAIPLTVTNSTESALSTSISFAEDELLDNYGKQWTLTLDAGESRALEFGSGGRGQKQFHLEVDPVGREAVASKMHSPDEVAVEIEHGRIEVSVWNHSRDRPETTVAETTTQRATSHEKNRSDD
jgi:hypothetical protein